MAGYENDETLMVAQFEKVSFQQYKEDWKRCNEGMAVIDEKLRREYDDIKLPARATSGSAGYDFFIPMSIHHIRGTVKMYPSGIRCKINPGWVLMLYPKSGLGCKYHMQLTNTTGVVDADYYGAKNEGHIMISIVSDKDLVLSAGDKFIQGIFLPYGITYADNTNGQRTGGFGSTGK